MRMTTKDIQKYPNFYKYVSTVLPTVKQSDAIVSTITALSGETDEEIVKKALTWGNSPLVKVGNTLSYGYYDPKKRDEIVIRRKWVKEFESGNGLRITKWGQLVELVEIILLHELTHWADDRDLIDHTGDQVEEGFLFERIVYGHVINGRAADQYYW
ncbi:MAG: hypothetical protein R2747_09815 [Pyrinomonadaceae bacterium]